MSLASLIVRVVFLPWTILKWLWNQTIRTAGNWWSFFAGVRPDDLIPPSLLSTIRWVTRQVPLALGTGTPAQQMKSSVVVAAAMVVASFGVLTYLAVLLIIPFTIGALRMIPFNNRLWMWMRGLVPSRSRRPSLASSGRRWKRD